MLNDTEPSLQIVEVEVIDVHSLLKDRSSKFGREVDERLWRFVERVPSSLCRFVDELLCGFLLALLDWIALIVRAGELTTEAIDLSFAL